MEIIDSARWWKKVFARTSTADVTSVLPDQRVTSLEQSNIS
jgi:hypothetical protein